MGLLLDECVPRRLRRELSNYDVSHVTWEGWAGQRNGALLELMRTAGFTGLDVPLALRRAHDA